jgi:hypothetical protein
MGYDTKVPGILHILKRPAKVKNSYQLQLSVYESGMSQPFHNHLFSSFGSSQVILTQYPFIMFSHAKGIFDTNHSLFNFNVHFQKYRILCLHAYPC